MSVLADFFLSTDADAPSYDGSNSLPVEDRVEGASLGVLELSTLWAIVEGR